ncbi:MAG TPA: FAD-dependent 5-carboxymethylaminomethyl-2-thiouridine(34) oxidoreductase MnmC [Usitatibacter sp.]|nr:FAD-dependent 5-carboxymethylaminomethyl-2-thiouridine(34) oxidoreductase MnmC [Usitatibacter sp.]
MPVTVPTASLDRTQAGIPYSREFDDQYHSFQGAIEQSRHVFLAGNGLPGRWAGRDTFTVLETGFGLGINFLVTWQAWREDARRPRRLHFVSVESRPLARDDLEACLAPYEPLQPLARALLNVWPPPLAGLHRLHFDGGNVILSLALGEAGGMLPRLSLEADALYLDGFTPKRNPAIWSPETVRELARLARPGATLATWTVAGGVRTALAGAGFHVEKRPGFGTKREMLAGAREGSPGTAPPDRRAIVVGAGLAGTLAAERLATRGWTVDLVDARPARSLPIVGLVRPVVNLRDALNAQASRGAFLYALQHFRALQHDGYHLQWHRCGVLQLAASPDEALRFEAIVRNQEYPGSFLRFVDGAEAARLAGRAVRGAGWWFPQGAWVSPSSLAVASLARAGAAIRRIECRAVARLERQDGGWAAIDTDGSPIAHAPTVVVANAADAARLVPQARLRLGAVRGQVTLLPPAPARRLDIIVSGSGYVAPLPEGGHVVGATYQHDDPDETVRASDHRENLARAESMLAGFTGGVHPMGLEGATGFRATVPDRLPIVGAGADDGLHFLTGLGSRGLLWAPLGAELVASALEREPLPLPADLAAAISPRRFLS